MFVVSLNLKRRHLDAAQRAMVASRLANLDHGQKKADVEISTTQTEAANLLNVSRESVISAKKVLDNGHVDSGFAVQILCKPTMTEKINYFIAIGAYLRMV